MTGMPLTRHATASAVTNARIAAFHAAVETGDVSALKAMLAHDVVFTSDGGGKRPAGPRPLVGSETVLQFLQSLTRLLTMKPSQLIRYGMINGLPGYVTLEADGELQTTAVDIRDGKVVAIYVMRNPDKLRHLEGTVH